MRGLLIKDIKLLSNQMRFYAALLALGILLMVFQENVMFAVSYISFMFGMFTISSISYDEIDHGTGFLMTLPITRKLYVQEKYVFALLSAGGSWLFSVIAGLITMAVKEPKTDLLLMTGASASILLVVFFMLSLILPVELCFGVEKGRIAMWGVTGGMLLLIIGGVKVLELMKVDYESIVNRFLENSWEVLAVAAVLFCGFVVFVSYQISRKGMEKKEF